MVYEFIGKVKNIKKLELLSEEPLRGCLSAINDKLNASMEIRILTDLEPKRDDVLVKAKASISSFAKLHDDELTTTITLFKDYLDEISATLDGDVSKSEGFYNDTKTFNKLW